MDIFWHNKVNENNVDLNKFTEHVMTNHFEYINMKIVKHYSDNRKFLIIYSRPQIL